jgi:hypothetical protein
MTMLKKTLLTSAFAALAVMTAAPTVAAPITVDNWSFETLPAGGLNNAGCGTGCSYSMGLNIPGWSMTGSSGQFQPGSTGAYFNSVLDGLTVGYTNGGSIFQMLSTTALASTTYQLFVDLGFRKDIADPATISLEIGSQTVLATGIADQLSGDWVTYMAVLTTTAADGGAAITIHLDSLGSQGDFDNVRLSDATAVPEPVTLSLVGFGLAGTVFLRRRKAKAG